jgi:perosamine synthetase
MISVFEPVIGEEEIKFVTDALRKGELSGTFGYYLEKFEKEFSAYIGCRYGVAVSNGTTALQLAVRAAGIQPGDEVLISASTNIATALSVVHNGAIPVPVDSEEETWNLDVSLIESLITTKTKAIIPVHLFGHPVEMDKLIKIANKYNLIVIEDCAESHGATYKGKTTGSFGVMGCFSFYANKIITTGEGGMVVTNDQLLAEKLRLLRNLAFTEPRFKHELAGYNFRMTGYQAAMGLAQTYKLDKVIQEKRRVAHTYNRLLSNIEGLQLPVERSWAKNVYWMYSVVVKPSFGMSRDELARHLKAKGVDTRTFFCSMSDQPCFENIKGYKKIPTPVASRIWESGLYLPSTHTLNESEIHIVAQAIKEIKNMNN